VSIYKNQFLSIGWHWSLFPLLTSHNQIKSWTVMICGKKDDFISTKLPFKKNLLIEISYEQLDITLVFG
jgi:hypothetical protein